MKQLPLLFSILGLLVGYILAKIAPEELQPGKKYIIFAKWTFFLLSIISIFLLLNSIDFMPLTASLIFLYLTTIGLQLHERKNKT